MARQPRPELLLARTTYARTYSRTDCPEQCRERRLRRIQMRRSRPNCSGAGHYESPCSSDSVHNGKPHFVETEDEKEEEEAEEKEEDEDTDQPAAEFPLPPPLPNPIPVFSTIAMKGFNIVGRMNSRLCVHEDFCRPEILGGEPLHFFAVYDGDASALYKELMHRFIAEELMSVDTAEGSGAAHRRSGDSSESSRSRPWLEDQLRTALRRSFERMDRVAMGACWCIENGYPCACKPICMLAFESSAATVAILTAELIVVAHCGVSRVVLCRSGIPIPLSHDHHKIFSRRYISQGEFQPERICGFSGRIVPYYNGLRVYKIVDMSRQLVADLAKNECEGNHVARSSSAAITTKPEISIVERKAEDECLILANDGIWEVMSNVTACNIATACLRDGNSSTSTSVMHLQLGDLSRFRHPNQILLDDDEKEEFPSKGSTDAAALLCRLALGRGSSDNMSVIVVDLKRQLLERQN